MDTYPCTKVKLRTLLIFEAEKIKKRLFLFKAGGKMEYVDRAMAGRYNVQNRGYGFGGAL